MKPYQITNKKIMKTTINTLDNLLIITSFILSIISLFNNRLDWAIYFLLFATYFKLDQIYYNIRINEKERTKKD